MMLYVSHSLLFLFITISISSHYSSYFALVTFELAMFLLILHSVTFEHHIFNYELRLRTFVVSIFTFSLFVTLTFLRHVYSFFVAFVVVMF